MYIDTARWWDLNIKLPFSIDYIEILKLAIVEPDDCLCIGRNMLFSWNS